jgi:peroxiredoxin
MKTVAALILSLFLAACSSDAPQLANGAPVPSFTVPRLEGGTATFPDDFRGKVVAIRFWADWCPFCKDEMMALEPVYQRLHGEGLHILAVNVRQDADTAGNFVRKLGISYETLLDVSGEVARSYGVQGLPTTFFIDRSGKLHARVLGESTPDVAERIVQEMLAKQ